MTKTSETVVFFGSGPVAARSLELLAKSFLIEAVITKPKPTHHKGTAPVLEVAEQLHLPVITATNKAELSTRVASQAFRSRAAVLVDFGIIVAQDVIDAFPLGIVNSHFSLLPEWRGADPITFAILSGQRETGISLMLLVEAMDEGPLLAQAPFELSLTTTAPQLTEELISLSNQLLKQVLPLYLKGRIQPMPQEVVALPNHDQPSYSRKLTKEDSVLDFTQPAAKLEREVRAFLGWPKSRTTVDTQDIVITQAHAEPGHGPVSTIWVQGKKFGFYTTDGIFVIDRLKPAGKGEMSAEAFLAGYGNKLKNA